MRPCLPVGLQVFVSVCVYACVCCVREGLPRPTDMISTQDVPVCGRYLSYVSTADIDQLQ